MPRITKEEQKRKDELLAKGLKECGTCGRVLPVEQFSKRTASKDGFNNQCKECDNIRVTQYYEEHKEERQQYQQQYMQQYMQQYQQEHKEIKMMLIRQIREMAFSKKSFK